MSTVWVLVVILRGVAFGLNTELTIVYPTEFECNRGNASITATRPIVKKECIKYLLVRSPV